MAGESCISPMESTSKASSKTTMRMVSALLSQRKVERSKAGGTTT